MKEEFDYKKLPQPLKDIYYDLRFVGLGNIYRGLIAGKTLEYVLNEGCIQEYNKEIKEKVGIDVIAEYLEEMKPEIDRWLLMGKEAESHRAYLEEHRGEVSEILEKVHLLNLSVFGDPKAAITKDNQFFFYSRNPRYGSSYKELYLYDPKENVYYYKTSYGREHLVILRDYVFLPVEEVIKKHFNEEKSLTAVLVCRTMKDLMEIHEGEREIGRHTLREFIQQYALNIPYPDIPGALYTFRDRDPWIRADLSK